MKNVQRKGLIALACAALVLAACGRRPQPAASSERAAEAVEVAPVQRLPVTVWVDASGTLEPHERVLVAAKVSGRVSAVERDLGDRVPEGSVLARLDDTDYQIALTQRKMALAEALAELGLTEPPPPGFDVAVVPRVRAARAQAANAAAKRDRIADLVKRDPSAFSQQDFEDVKTA
ncbi:MAG TPA: biotin/lipoyl-binding protein, partial [Phycisphaerales bacterium]|nr:biotin/lipoyl-binding protein [Phycisphaerales bacterium]